MLNGGTKDNRWNIPANVTTSVRVAQYLSIFVALLMEEEVSIVLLCYIILCTSFEQVSKSSYLQIDQIPTGLYLLRQIRKKEFIKRLDNMNYKKFVFASILRIFSG